MLENAAAAFTNALSSMIYTPVAEEGDYHEDGLLFCGKCRTRRQMEIDLLGDGVLRKVPVMCDCQAEENERQISEDKAHEARMNQERRRLEGISSEQWRQASFVDDDRRDERASEVCMRYAKNFEQMQNSNMGLMLYGEVGSGKTFLAACIANALLEQGSRVMMASLPTLIAQMGADFGEERADILRRVTNADLLVLDDVGVERDTEYSMEQAYEVINARYKSGKPLVVTTNLSMRDLKGVNALSKSRIYDRLKELCHPVLVKGGSRRAGIASKKTALDLLEGI